MSKIQAIGMIVEDDSDFDSFRTLIKRTIQKDNIKFKKAIGHGCGKLKRKAKSYFNTLSLRGCNLIILVHDLDRNNEETLKNELNSILKDSPAKFNYLCIPKEEIEAWFLADPEGIQSTLKLTKKPKIKGLPETIKSPKEELEKIVKKCSNKEKIYLNTKHNALLSENVSLDLLKNKCQSFKELSSFIEELKY